MNYLSLIAFAENQASNWNSFAHSLGTIPEEKDPIDEVLHWVDYHVSNLPVSDTVLKPGKVKRWVVNRFPELETMTEDQLTRIDKYIEERVAREVLLGDSLDK